MANQFDLNKLILLLNSLDTTLEQDNKESEVELSNEVNFFVHKFKNSYSLEIDKIKKQLNSYDTVFVNLNNTIELYKKYRKENEQLFKQIKNGTDDILTNERKTYYEDQQNDTLNKYYYFLLVIYILIVIYIGILFLIYPSPFTLRTKLFIIGMIFILPFISAFLLGYIIKLIYWLFGLLPKNVYK